PIEARAEVLARDRQDQIRAGEERGECEREAPAVDVEEDRERREEHDLTGDADDVDLEQVGVKRRDAEDREYVLADEEQRGDGEALDAEDVLEARARRRD